MRRRALVSSRYIMFIAVVAALIASIALILYEVGERGLRALLGFDVRGPDHLGPLFGFLNEELFEIGRRAAEHHGIQFCKLRLERGIDERGVELFVKAVDDFGRSG